jgi:outer membrane murein-binding lipoprotein Lpp
MTRILIAALLLTGCAPGQPPSKTEKPESDPQSRQALRRLASEVNRLGAEAQAQNDYTALANARLKRDIAKLEGKVPDLAAIAKAQTKVDADRRAGLHPEAPHDPSAHLALMVRITDCQAAVINRHNQFHPEDPWADVDDVRDFLGGKPDEKREAQAEACAKAGGLLQNAKP